MKRVLAVLAALPAMALVAGCGTTTAGVPVIATGAVPVLSSASTGSRPSLSGDLSTPATTGPAGTRPSTSVELPSLSIPSGSHSEIPFTPSFPSGTGVGPSSTGSGAGPTSSVPTAPPALTTTGAVTDSAPPTTHPPTTHPTTTSRPTTSAAPAGALTAATTTWFSTYCSGLLPIGAVADIPSQISAATSDYGKLQALYVKYFNAFGQAFVSTAASLKKLPPPTLTGAKGFDTKIENSLSQQGPALVADARALEAIDVQSDLAGFADELQKDAPALTSAGETIQLIGSVPVSVEENDAISRIPACQKLEQLS